MDSDNRLPDPEEVKTTAVEIYESEIQVFVNCKFADYVFDISTDRYGRLIVNGEIYRHTEPHCPQEAEAREIPR
tara:strand:+ start:162 stop:383 length:222 start_codon:yes stop_codon:yes gene_type:complete